ncbi:MAG: SAM-dependent methyltransferase [Hungatella hathewayi]|nr:SAM-dependent methyltransferase [Hungatella hathewayi]
MELSKRLHMVASMVEKGSIPADVGCDHGYVAIYLIQNGISPHVFAMDVNEGPLERAREHVEEYGLAAYIDVRLSDGLSGLPCRGGRPEADTLLAAGMGGRLMVKIMEEGRVTLAQMRWAILQPQSEIAKVRAFLLQEGFLFIQEDMVEEDGKYYTVMDVSRGAMEEMSQAERLYGAYLIRHKNPVLREFLKRERDQLLKIREQLNAQSTDSARARLAELTRELDWNREAQDEMQ